MQKENITPDYQTWWKGLNEEEQTKLCQKHFAGIPIDSLMERSIKVMFHYENPETTTNTVTGGEVVLPTYSKGEWQHLLHDGIVTCGGLNIANCTNAFVSKGTAKANANRIVNCVKNFDAMNDFITRMASIKLPNGTVNGDYINTIVEEAKQVLNNIL